MVDRAVRFKPVDSFQELFEHEPDFHTSQPGTQAQVWAAATERHVVVALSSQVEPEWVLEARRDRGWPS